MRTLLCHHSAKCHSLFLPTDVGVRTALTRLGADPVEAVAASGRWRPWRSYALLHLWQTLMPPTPDQTPTTHEPTEER